jgi:hypothetical protein
MVDATPLSSVCVIAGGLGLAAMGWYGHLRILPSWTLGCSALIQGLVVGILGLALPLLSTDVYAITMCTIAPAACAIASSRIIAQSPGAANWTIVYCAALASMVPALRELP